VPIDYPPSIQKLASGGTLPTAASVAEGSLLSGHPDDFGEPLLRIEDISGTKDWMGGPLSTWSKAARTLSGTSSDALQPPSTPLGATHLLIRRLSFTLDSTGGTAHDGTNNFTFLVRVYGGTTVSLGSTSGQVSTSGVGKRYTIEVNQIFAIPADGADPGHPTNQFTVTWTKNNAPGNVLLGLDSILCSAIYR